MLNSIKKELKNAEGKRLLEKTRLDYSKNIIDIIMKEPNLLYYILDSMQLSEDEFFKYLSGDEKANIVVYDQMLVLAKRKNLIKIVKNK